MKLVHNVSDDELAKKFIEKQPDAYGRKREWSGGRYGDYEFREHVVFESLEEIDGYVAVSARQRALAKLTDEDKRALGLL